MSSLRLGDHTVPDTSPAEAQAHRDVTRMTGPELAAALQDVLGGRLVAYLGGVRETRAVSQWAAGDRAPAAVAVERFRVAYLASQILLRHDSPGVVQAWFQGMNPDLGDQAPAWVLRRQELEEAGPAVLAAARRFAAN